MIDEDILQFIDPDSASKGNLRQAILTQLEDKQALIVIDHADNYV